MQPQNQTRYPSVQSADKLSQHAQQKTLYTGGSRLSHTAVKPDSHLAQIFCRISFLYNLINLMQISTDKPDN